MATSPSFFHQEPMLNLAKPVIIKVLEGCDLKGVKGEAPVTFVRAEYNGLILGDSPKVDVSSDGNVQYNFTTTFDIHPEGPNLLDDIAHKPLLFTVIEVLPKEKKQKEEKTATLGQAALDLLPLLQGSREFKTTLPLYPVPGSPLEALRSDAKCTISVLVSIQDSLLSPGQLSEGNLLRVTVEGAYAVPEWFNLTGPPQNYMVGFQVPAVGEKECAFVFRNGTLKLGGEREPVPRPKKWPVSNIVAAGAQNIPDCFILGGDYEEEVGELTSLEDREIRIQGETYKKRIMWDLERRCYLDPAAVTCFRKRIAECRYWPVEMARMPAVTSTKAKGGKAEKGGGGGTAGGGEEETISFHGVAYVNMVPLLYPGVTCIRGAFHIMPYYEGDVYERTKCTFSLFREGHHLPGNRLGGAGPPHIRAAGGKNTEKMVRENIPRRMSVTLKSQVSEIAVEVAGSMCQNLEGQQYLDAGTFLVLEFSLDKALVPKRLPEELASRVQDMIPPHPQLPRKTAGAKKAVEDYHAQIISIAETILVEYHELFGRQLEEGQVVDEQTLEDQKCQLNYELNSSGKYFAFKEQLKHAVVKIVREKYLKTTAFENLDELQAFLSELYVYLVDQMHVALNQVLTQQSPSPPPPTYNTSEHLLLFAREAQTNEDYALASTYYQERLGRNRQDIESWLNYGAFCLLIEDNLKAQECFREAVALDHNHLPSLLMCGIMAVMLENYEEAELFFEEATSLEPDSVLAWTILGMFYDIQEDDIRVEMAFRKANRLLKARLAKEKLAEQAEAGGQKPPSPSAPGSVEPVSFSKEDLISEQQPDVPLKIHSDLVEPTVTIRLPEEESIGTKFSRKPSATSSRLKMPSMRGRVLSDREAVEKSPLVACSARFISEPAKVPVSAAESDLPPSTAPPVSIFREAIRFLMDVNALQFVHRALAHELVSPQGGPSCEYYLVLAQTYLLKKEYEKAEECLELAVQIDYLNPDVWAQKGHLCYLTQKFSEAKACYERTVSFVNDATDMHFVYLRLGTIYLEEKECDKAKHIFLLASKKSPSCLTWLGVGIACYRLKQMADAEDALSEANALNNNNPEVWAYLSLVCMEAGRQLEAEQSYKYAIKLGLDNDDLLRELQEMHLKVGFGNPSF